MITRSECLNIAAIIRNSRPEDDRSDEVKHMWFTLRENLIPFLELHCSAFDTYAFRMLTETRIQHNDPWFTNQPKE